MEAEAALAPRTRDRIRPEGGQEGERRLVHLSSERVACVSMGNASAYDDYFLNF